MVSANNGTLMNEATYAAGKVGQAFSLDGVDDYVSLPKVPAWDFGSGSFSISAWFKTDAGTRMDYRQIIRYDTGGLPSGAWGVDVTPEQKIRFGIASIFYRESDEIISTNAYADDAWHLVTAIRDAEEGFLKLYIDGSPAADDVVDRSLTVLGENNTPLLIGAAGWGAGYFPGLIDEVMVAGRAFTANEISALYAAGSAGVCGSHVYLPTVIR
jgi:Concanavalin A-like lectin/glucanases superfamily